VPVVQLEIGDGNKERGKERVRRGQIETDAESESLSLRRDELQRRPGLVRGPEGPGKSAK